MRIDFDDKFGVIVANDLTVTADAAGAGLGAGGRGIRWDRRRRFIAVMED